MRPLDGKTPSAPTQEVFHNQSLSEANKVTADEHDGNHLTGNSVIDSLLADPRWKVTFDGQLEASPPTPIDVTAGASYREKRYLEMCRADSGAVVDLEYFEKKKEDRARLLQQSEWIAD